MGATRYREVGEGAKAERAAEVVTTEEGSGMTTTDEGYKYYRVVHDDKSVYRQEGYQTEEVYDGEGKWRTVILSEQDNDHMVEITPEEAQARMRGK